MDGSTWMAWALRMGLGLAVVTAVMLLVLRRAGVRLRPAGGRALRSLARLPLDGGRALHVVEAPGVHLLVASGPEGVQVLRELDAEAVREALDRPPDEDPGDRG